MKTIKNQYRSTNNQHKLKVLCDMLCDDIENILDAFDIDYKHNGKMLTMSCPIHSGDNPSAINIYPDGDTYRGNWKCRTHNCEEIFKGSIIGFIRGIISNKKYNWQKSGDNMCPFNEAVEFCTKFLNKSLQDIKISSTQKDKQNFTNTINYLVAPKAEFKDQIARPTIRQSLSLIPDYYINRGYSKEILDRYDVGLCTKEGKEMSGRIVVPIYDNDHEYMIGCTGRSIYDKCTKCQSFHNPELACPDQENKWKYSKWKHNNGFKAQEYLYNFWFAKPHITETSYAIIVESPGNVWKLEENGIHNSVAIFGTNLSTRQKLLLDASGAMSLFIIMDKDDAGKKAAETIYSKCSKTYKVYNINISKNDIGEMTEEEINNEIKTIIGQKI
jgi:hypothetical protein